MAPSAFTYTDTLTKQTMIKLALLALVMTRVAQAMLIVDGSFDREAFDDSAMTPFVRSERTYAMLPYSGTLRTVRTLGLNSRYQPIGESYFPRRTKSKREIDDETQRGQLAGGPNEGRDVVGKRLFVARIGKRQINIARVG